MPNLDHQPVDAAVHQPVEGGPSFSMRNRLTRLAWRFSWLLLAAWTPPSLWQWRRLLLVVFGARMAPRCDVRGSARVWLPSNLSLGDRSIIAERVNFYNMAQITIGDRVIISQDATLCAGTHRLDDPGFQLVVKPITVGSFAWLAAESFVGPGAIIAEGAVLGARSVTFGRLEPWTVYTGNPARAVKVRSLA